MWSKTQGVVRHGLERVVARPVAGTVTAQVDGDNPKVLGETVSNCGPVAAAFTQGVQQHEAHGQKSRASRTPGERHPRLHAVRLSSGEPIDPGQPPSRPVVDPLAVTVVLNRRPSGRVAPRGSSSGTARHRRREARCLSPRLLRPAACRVQPELGVSSGCRTAPRPQGDQTGTLERHPSQVPGRVSTVGSWWSVEVGDREVPIWGKNYVPDTLMLAFADEDLVVDRPSIEALERCEPDAPAADSQLDLEHDVRQSRLFHYTATAGTIRTRLALQGFSTNWVRKLVQRGVSI